MFLPIFKGKKYSYSYEKETDQYLLFVNDCSVHVLVKGGDAFMFREHINLMMLDRNDTLKDRIEEVIEIHYNFDVKPSPMPQFNE